MIRRQFLQLVALGDKLDLADEARGRGFGERHHESHERDECDPGNAGLRARTLAMKGGVAK